MGASALLQIVQQVTSNLTQVRQCKRTGSTSSYEQSRKVPMHSTSCCDSNISIKENLYCNINVTSSQENLYCYAVYTAPVQAQLLYLPVVTEENK